MLLKIGRPSRGRVMRDFRDSVNDSAGDWGELDGRRGAAGARRPDRNNHTVLGLTVRVDNFVCELGNLEPVPALLEPDRASSTA